MALILCVSFTFFHLQRLRDISRKKSDELTRLYSQMRWLGQHNANLVLQNIDANTKMTDLGARQQALEEEMAGTAGERDVQRAAAEQIFWGCSGVPPVVAPEGGLALPRARSSLPQCSCTSEPPRVRKVPKNK